MSSKIRPLATRLVEVMREHEESFMSSENKAFIVVIALLIGALGVELAPRVLGSTRHGPAAASEHRIEK